jgi:hypothetical protein
VCEGFWSVIPLQWIEYLTADELETQICGASSIDLNDWKANTENVGFIALIPSLTLSRFWEIMATYD